MTVRTGALGKAYPPTVYAVGREKVREYALAVGETNPVHLDVQAARRAGYADIVAPPMFAVVYSTPAVAMAVFDPDVAMSFAMEVHGAQEFCWGPLVIAGERSPRAPRSRTSTSTTGAGSASLRLFRSTSVARPSAPAHG